MGAGLQAGLLGPISIVGMFFRDTKQWSNALRWFERAVKASDEDGLIGVDGPAPSLSVRSGRRSPLFEACGCRER